MDRFKTILVNMSQEELLNFIWLYGQYITKMNEMRWENEEDIYPVSLKVFHDTLYKQMIS